jgi:Skp family chaperone for outer membrane proteins
MGGHVSHTEFLGGLLLGGLIAGFGVLAWTHWTWGKRKKTLEAELRRAQVSEEAAKAREAAALVEAAQDRTRHEEQLAAMRTAHEEQLAATRAAAEQARAAHVEQLAATRTEHEEQLAATRAAAEQDLAQARAEHEEQLADVRDSYHRARAEARYRSLSVSRTDWHDSFA